MRSTRRKTVLWLVGLSLAAVVAVAIFGRQQIIERWYIYQLDSDDAETVDDAARQLATMGSTRAIMPLIEQLPREVAKGRGIAEEPAGYLARPSCWTDSAVLMALYDLGEPAKEALERERKNDRAGLDDLLEVMLAEQSLLYSKERPVQQPKVFSNYIIE